MKRRVAIIAGMSFPPIASASVHRVLAWLRYLPRFDWNGEVFTLPEDYRPRADLDASLLALIPSASQVHRVDPIWPKRIPQSRTMNAEVGASGVPEGPGWRLVHFVKDRIGVPDARLLWVPPAFGSFLASHRRHHYDAVVSTSQENSSHMVGLIASVVLRVPWVADFQDPWRSPWLPLRHGLHERLDRSLARTVLRRSDAITAISPNVGRSLEEDYRADRGKIEVIPNGFEPTTAEPMKERATGDRFTLLHTGRFYGQRTPAWFLRAVDSYIADHPEIGERLLVRFIGAFDEPSAAAVAPYADRSWLNIVRPVPHADALQAQAEADALLLIPGERSMSMPGKIFEYLRTGRPMLCIASDDSDAAVLLRELNTGSVVRPDDSAALERFFHAALIDRSLGAHTEPIAQLDRYQWRHTVERMAQVLDQVVT